MKFLKILETHNKPHILVIIGFALTGLIGIIDFLLGYELAFSVFYVVPVALVTWSTNRSLGLVTSFVSALVWLMADIAAGHPYSYPLIPIWNALIRFSFFVIITLLLSELRKSTEHERELSRIDSLTGAVHSRVFYDLAAMEINRFQRYEHPFTIAYIDLDNFKAVNDQFGHPAGDQVLRITASCARKHLRKTDVVARLGGDEFALLLPETNEESARITLAKIQDSLSEEMRLSHWPVTFSMGVLTCISTPPTIEELMVLVDGLMYSVKRDNKNSIKFSTYAS